MLKTRISSKVSKFLFCCCCCVDPRCPATPPPLMTHDSIAGCGHCCFRGGGGCCCCWGGRGRGGRIMSVCVSFCSRLANILKRLLICMYMTHLYIACRYIFNIDFEVEFCWWLIRFPQRAQRMKRGVWRVIFICFCFCTIHEICLLLFIWCVCVCSMCVCVWEEIRAETSNAHELAKKRKQEKIYKKKKYGFFFFSFYKCFSGWKGMVRDVFLGWVFGIERERGILFGLEGSGAQQMHAEQAAGCFQSDARWAWFSWACVCVNEYGRGEHLIHMVYAMYVHPTICVLNIEKNINKHLRQ